MKTTSSYTSFPSGYSWYISFIVVPNIKGNNNRDTGILFFRLPMKPWLLGFQDTLF